MRILLLASVVVLSGFTTYLIGVDESSAQAASQPSAQQESVRAEIARMMDSAAAAWNRGDLDRFMQDYAPDTTTTFIGSKGILRGRKAIRKAYAPRFAPGGVRDSLSFENLEVDMLAKDVVNVIAYYRLMRKDSTTGRGPTSLVMRKIKGRWLIIHDHSS
jgi:uncharacterized protein (TIGR02246 family)